jgi:hypothetical protein
MQLPILDFQSISSHYAAVILTAAISTAVAFLYLGGQRIRRLTIAFAEFLLLLLLWLATVVGAVSGYNVAYSMRLQMAPSQADSTSAVAAGILGGIAGAGVSFALAAVPFALVFVLVEISSNTRRIAESP